MTQVIQKTTLEAPDRFLGERTFAGALRFRAGEWGCVVRPRGRDGIVLTSECMFSGAAYKVVVWGNPSGHVRARAWYS